MNLESRAWAGFNRLKLPAPGDADGSAGISFNDGLTAIAALDRRGVRRSFIGFLKWGRKSPLKAMLNFSALTNFQTYTIKMYWEGRIIKEI